MPACVNCGRRGGVGGGWAGGQYPGTFLVIPVVWRRGAFRVATVYLSLRSYLSLLSEWAVG